MNPEKMRRTKNLMLKVDMFPCTAGVDLFPCCVDIHGIVSTHVENVCLLLRKGK